MATFSSFLKVGDTFHQYYHSSLNTICHATSSDGKTWVKDDENNPVLSKSVAGWDRTAVGVPMVWKEGDTWYMLFRGTPSDQVEDATGLATSSDGITWTKYTNNPVLTGSAGEWDENGAEVWGLIKVGATYYVYYECTHKTLFKRCIGVATSTDLITWTKDANNPIMISDLVGGRFCPFVFKKNNYYYMICPRYTIATDATEFELYRDVNPTFYVAERYFIGIVKRVSSSGWDSADEDTPFILTDNINRDTFECTNGEIWMYVSGDGGSNVWSEGLFISTDFDW